MNKKISIVTPCFNEEANIEHVVSRVRNVMRLMPYEWEHIFIDNASVDSTVHRLKSYALNDNRIKIIVNARNFGHIRSPYYALLLARGDAVISMASDLQDPPELIPELIHQWQIGYQIVLAKKIASHENYIMFSMRTLYYKFISSISDVNLIQNVTGFGLYSQDVIETLRRVNDPAPYLRGLVSELGFNIATVDFIQPRRSGGISKNNFYTLYDNAMLGITNHSKVPLRFFTFLGFCIGFFCIIISFVFFILKLFYWSSFSLGMAPLLIGFFFLGALQLIFLGLIGEYIGSIHTKLRNLPLVVEAERINFDQSSSDSS